MKFTIDSLPFISLWPFSLLKRFGMRQFVKFVLVGFVNTGIDYGVYILLTRVSEFFRENFLIANLISFLVAVSNSYLMNKYWTFRDKETRYHVQFSKFTLVNVVALSISELILYFLVNGAGLYDLLSKAVAVVTVVFWNFFANKYWVFTNAAKPVRQATEDQVRETTKA